MDGDREKEAEQTSKEVMGATFPATWLALDVALRRPRTWHTQSTGHKAGNARHTEALRERALRNLEQIARQAWRLLLHLFDAHAFVLDGHASVVYSVQAAGSEPHDTEAHPGVAAGHGGGGGLWELVTFERFALVLARIHEASWQVGGLNALALPSPLALYAHTCLSSSSSSVTAAARVFQKFLPALAQEGDELTWQEAPDGNSTRAGSNIETAHSHAQETSMRKQRKTARGAAPADKRKQASAFSALSAARRILKAARSSVPSFAGSALFRSVSRLSVVEKDEDANCQLVFDGPRLEVVVVATRQIKSGELLTLPASCFDEEPPDDDSDHDSQDEADQSQDQDDSDS